jgi:tRNA A-37 threonylcarbamoyl transferase component Bud32
MHSVLGTGHLVAGRYRLIDQLGRGAMGIVWRGRDELLDRDVAIKQIVLQPLASAAEARFSFQRTLREARTAARLSHPGVVTVFDVVEENGSPWIVMELVRARPLDQVIAEDGPLPPARAAQLGLGLLDALATAHTAGVLHRDVKPSNVLIRPDGKAVLTDFGIATIQGDASLTQAGMVVGTPGFSSPERVRGTAATPASDLWSLGATLYAAVEGRGPFDRAGGSAAIVASIATEPAPRAPSAGPLAPVIEALLRADPAQRPDAATTARMLRQAWRIARTPEPAGLALHPLPGADAPASPAQAGPLAAGIAGAGEAAGLAQAAQPAACAGQPGTGATTATQVVAVPPDPGSIGAAGQGYRAGLGRSDDLAVLPGIAANLAPAAGASTPGATARAAGVVAAPGAGAAAEAAAVASGPALAGAAEATSVVPDLMATPNFAALRMPDAAAADASFESGDLGLGATVPPSADPPASTDVSHPLASPARPSRRTDFFSSRRGLALLAPVAAIAIVAGIIFLALPRFGVDVPFERLGGGGGQNPNTAAAGHGKQGDNVGSRPGDPSSGSHGKTAPSARPTPGKSSGAGKPSASGKPRPSAKPSSSGKPSASSSPTTSTSPSTSASPTPTATHTSPASGGGLPAGFQWYRVSAAEAGTLAGFRVAGPSGWVLTPGTDSVIKPASGPGRLTVAMATWAGPGPVKEARRLQVAARDKYPNYQVLSITGMTYRTWPAARWRFEWQSASAANPSVVTEILFTVQTWEGPQQYILAVSSPEPKVSWAEGILAVAKRTFKPLPQS